MWHRGMVLLAMLAALVPAGARAASEPPVSVTLRDADIRQAVAQLLRDTGINYVFAEEAPGKVTASLKDVPLRQALRLLLAAAGCEASESDGVVVIRRRAEAQPPAPEAAKAPDASGEPSATAPNEASGEQAPGAAGTEGAPAMQAGPEQTAALGTPAEDADYVLLPPEGVQELGVPAPSPLGLPFYTPVNPNLARALAWMGGNGGLWRLSHVGRGVDAGGAPRGLWDYFGR